jgi:hypothetical protein
VTSLLVSPIFPNCKVSSKIWGRAASNVFFVKGVGLINIHVRTEAPGWWNIQKSIMDQLDYLQERGVKRYFIFLIGREDEDIADGYIVSDFNEFIRAPSNEEPTKFTIRERQHLDPGKLVLAARKLARELLRLGKAVKGAGGGHDGENMVR